ncbi:MAG: hypothetical protein WCB18_04530 [Thermoplasmata archaeon]
MTTSDYTVTISEYTADQMGVNVPMGYVLAVAPAPSRSAPFTSH